MKFIKKLPMATSGISLALAALGNLLLPYGEAVKYTCGILSAAILTMFALKLALDFKQVREELKSPVVLGILPTSTMALMLLCTYAKPYLGMAAAAIWYAAIITHVLIMLLFAARFIMGFNIKNIFPSWFVACVGIVAASVTSPAMEARFLGQIIFYAGLVLYIIILPIIAYKVIKAKRLPEPVRPTLAIFAAPACLCIVGHMSAFEQPNALLVYILLTVAVICYVYVSVNMIFLLRLKFYPTYAAFTFPYVISATAFKMSNALLIENGFTFFAFVPKISEWIAVIMVAYVLVRYAVFLLSATKNA